MTPTLTQTSSRNSPTAVERISEVPGFEAIRSEWTELLKASDSDCLFLSWEWLYAWWKHLADGRQLSILAVRHEGRLVALAPLARRRASL